MKSRFVLLALAALFAPSVYAAGFSVYMNTESPSSCSVASLTSMSVLPDGNWLALTPGATFSSGCGLTGANSVTFGPASPLAPATTTLSTNTGTVSFTFHPLNATQCTGSITGASGGAFTSGSTLCNSSAACSTAVSAPATFTNSSTTAAATYNVAVTCTGSGNPATTTATVTAPQQGSSGGGASCTNGVTGDIPNFTALCSGPLSQHTGQSGVHTLGSGNYTYSFVFGAAWPGSYYGYTEIMPVGKAQFVSIPINPSPGHSVQFVNNNTYTPEPVTYSISTQPGLFNNAEAGNGVICVESTSPAFIASSSQTVGVQCVLNANQQYWLNMINATYSGGVWTPTCTSTCNIGTNLNDEGN